MNWIRCVFALATCLPTPLPADVRTVVTYRDRTEIVIEGRLEAGDFERFIRAVKDSEGRASSVWLFTPGGDFEEAMRIGRAIRALELTTVVPARDDYDRPECDDEFSSVKPNDPDNCTCASAGFFIYVGGVYRARTYVAVHRPTFDQARFADLSATEAEMQFNALQATAREYLTEMGVPTQIQDTVLSTPSDEIVVLDHHTVMTHLFGHLPYREEWLTAKSAQMSKDERARYQALSEKAREKGGLTNLAKAEQDETLRLSAKLGEETDARVELMRQGRLAAFERYFGSKPSDVSNHKFLSWVDSKRYLGKRFDDIVAEERFEEEEDGFTCTLSRAQTVTAPAVFLYDSALHNDSWLTDPDARHDSSKRKVVTSVSVHSHPNPSPEFLQQLKKTLEAAWGEAADGDAPEELDAWEYPTLWTWDLGEYSAVVYGPYRAAGGLYYRLELEAKGATSP